VRNRRNYYRLLQVQPDAATEVIKASYRTLMQKLRFHPDLGGDDWNATLINEAYGVLSDPACRARYDAARKEELMGLGTGGRTAGAPRAKPDAKESARRAQSAFESLTCPVCRTVNTIPPDLPEARRCLSCRSPLGRVDTVASDVPGGRAVPRLERRIPVRFALASDDNRAGHGVAEDLSSHGMRFITGISLPEGELLRLECALLSAVARVITCRDDPEVPQRYVVGVAFVTVEFAHQKGSLFEYDA
jgi:curved DNA-binding protein CbpA